MYHEPVRLSFKTEKTQQTLFYPAGLWNLLIHYLAGEEEGQNFQKRKKKTTNETKEIKKKKTHKRNTEMVCGPLT